MSRKGGNIKKGFLKWDRASSARGSVPKSFQKNRHISRNAAKGGTV